MIIGFMGLGKLGLPVALAVESKGHTVLGYDIDPAVATYLEKREIPFKERGLQPLLDETKLELVGNPHRLVAECDIIFVPIQTPHGPEYEGSTRLPDDRKDFDYYHLLNGIKQLAADALALRRHVTVAVISTCLPGTFERRIKPYLNEFVHYVYTPQFIAMGTVLEDYLHPEFNLIGVHDEKAADQLAEFYESINEAPCLTTDITTAEAIKVSYNTFITMKTVLANTWGEIAHKLGANVDDITYAWTLSDKRLLSSRYLRSGVGDGGGCHPRDNIALSWLAQELDLSHNLFEDLMKAREDHMAWLAKEVALLHIEHKLPVIILGRAFKPETNIETGSPAILLSKLLAEYGIPHEHVNDLDTLGAAIYVIGTTNKRYRDYPFPLGSVVFDPFGNQPTRSGVDVIRVGRNSGTIA